MTSKWMTILRLWSLFYCLPLPTHGAVSYDNPDCVLDSSLAPSATGNYVDCTTELMVKLGRTECCKIDDAKGCCKPGGSWEEFKLIGIILGVVTASLAALVVYWFWCRKDNPVTQRAGRFLTRRYHRVQEACSCCGCCRRAVERRRREEELRERAKEVPAFDLPMESAGTDPTIDKFWNGPLVKS